MRHSEATRVLHKHKVWKDLHDGQSKIHYVSERDSRRAKIPPGHVWSRVRANENDFGHTITVARQQSKIVSELSFLTAVHTAKGIAKQEGRSEVRRQSRCGFSAAVGVASMWAQTCRAFVRDLA
jgi:hypothetical protein